MYKWNVIFHITPSLFERESSSKYNVKGNFVDFEYVTSDINEKKTNKCGKNEYAEQAVAHDCQLEIKELMVQRMIYRKKAESIEVIMTEEPELLNKEELKNEGRTVDHPLLLTKIFTSTNNILDYTNYLQESQDFWASGFKNKIEGKENEVLRVADWIILAEKQDDSIKRFILTWIAFNGLYSLFCETIIGSGCKNDSKKMKDALNGLLNEEEAGNIINNNSSILDSLQSFDVMADEITNYSDELKKLRSSTASTNMEIILCAVQCIYGVRKQVFHEAPVMENDIDYKCKISKELLTIITMQCLKNFVSY